jgi:tetratricopeptide (TPR) repeat protein
MRTAFADNDLREQFSRGAYSELIKACAHIVENCRRQTIQCQGKLGNALRDLGRAYYEAGDLECSAKCWKEASEIDFGFLGELSEEYVTDLSNLARVYTELSQADAAESLITKALGLVMQLPENEQAPFSTVLINVGIASAMRGDYDCAHEIFLSAMRSRLKLFGAGHPKYAITLYYLARVYYSLGRQALAEQTARKAIQIFENARETESANYSMLQVYLGDLLKAKGLESDAYNCYCRAMSVLARARPPGHSERRVVAARLATVNKPSDAAQNGRIASDHAGGAAWSQPPDCGSRDDVEWLEGS